MDDKIIVTNLSALKAKYKTAGIAKIKKACNELIASDKKRGLATRIINIDDAQAMKKLGGTAVTNVKDPGQNKRAIDAVYKKLTPDYILILGSTDVIPHQDMKNPVPQDGDAHALGDLPYACEKAYSRKPEDFVGPTRVVGRLPDLVGDNDPAYLIRLLKTATNFKTRPISDYDGYFAISAAVWEGSTRLSLDNVFGFNDKLNLSPDKGPNWTAASLSKKLHFINCHGGTASPTFQGQKRKGKPGVTYPDAHDAALLKDVIVEGTVAAVECCYGAEQYDAKLYADGKTSISSAYLAGKAYGFFGSSTIAYGPADDNGAADLICQYFLKYVMEGASLGRAALQARQDFAQSSPNLDPMDIKTLAQFSLLGDPSVVPIKASSPHLVATPKGKTNSKPKSTTVDSKTIERGERRQQLFTKGTWLTKNQAVCSSTPESGSSKAVEATMKEIASRANIENPVMSSYAIKRKGPSGVSFAKSMTATAFHVAMPTDAAEKQKENISSLVCVVAKEVDGRIVSYRELHSKK
jgi:hypothetical protein